MSVDFFIFVPAYNVATTLAPVLQKISDEVWNRSIVLVIDDGSVDDTHGSFENFVEALNSEPTGVQKKMRLRYMRLNKITATVLSSRKEFPKGSVPVQNVLPACMAMASILPNSWTSSLSTWNLKKKW